MEAQPNLKRHLPMEDLASELQCSICLELYRQPIILPCSHVLCRSPCAERLFQHNFIRCPICRDNCYVAGGASNLPRVLTLENIIERYQADAEREEVQEVKEDTLRSRDVPCQLCQGNPRKARKSCVDCNASYCGPCLEMSHPNREPFSNHTLTMPKRHPRPKEVKCTQHGEVCSMYCESCRVLVCMQCLLVDGHIGHSSVAIDAAYTKMKKQLEDNIWLLENSQQPIYSDAVKIKEEFCAELKDILASRRLAVNEQCKALIAAIENKRTFFLSDLDYEEQHLSNGVRVQVDELKKRLTDCQSLSHYAAEVLEENDYVSFLQLASGINRRILRRTVTMEDVLTPNANLANLNEKIVDLRKEHAILSQMHYITAPSAPNLQSRCSMSSSSVVIHLRQPVCDVIDGYIITYMTEDQAGNGMQDIVRLTASSHFEDERQKHVNVLLLDNLRINTCYRCTLRAWNGAGEGEVSQVIDFCTLPAGQLDMQIPEITESLCRTFATTVQIHSPTTAEPPEQVSYNLVYREAAGNKTWRMFKLYDRSEHRVFGLKHNTTYEFAIWASDESGQGVKSSHVFLNTDSITHEAINPSPPPSLE